MKNYRMFNEDMVQFKANLHAHSTVSDGKITREEMIAHYKANGYHILCFSDHERYCNTTAYDQKDFIVLPAIERSIQGVPNHQECHINGIGNPSSSHLMEDNTYIPVVHYTSLQDVQGIIDQLKETDNLVFINHPYWSCTRMDFLLSLKNYDGIEIYNHGSQISTLSGFSETYYDELIWNKTYKMAVATDDNHNSSRYSDEITYQDSCGGWVNILAHRLDKQAIYDSLKAGLFYSSQGPVIKNYGMKDGKLFVECSKCKEIAFITYPRRGYHFSCDTEEGFTSHEYTLRGKEEVVRIVCIDEDGKKAWTNVFEIQK